MYQIIELTKESKEALIKDTDSLCENLAKRIKTETKDARMIKARDMLYDIFDMIEKEYYEENYQ